MPDDPGKQPDPDIQDFLRQVAAVLGGTFDDRGLLHWERADGRFVFFDVEYIDKDETLFEMGLYASEKDFRERPHSFLAYADRVFGGMKPKG
jgi:hypothetical protein